MSHRLRRFCSALPLLVYGGLAVAQASASLFVEELTWTELRDRVRGGATTIIVPIGGTEQNGPAMVLGKHNVRVKALAEKIAAGLGGALVAPVDPYVPEGTIDPPTGHMRFPGTVTVPEAVFEATLDSIARSYRRHGFADVVLLGDHGGYRKSIERVAERLNREWAGAPARVHAAAVYSRSADVDDPQALKRQGYREAEIGSHAGLADTSLSLAIDPRLVRTEHLRDGTFGPTDGVHGEPARASAEAGRVGVELIVRQTVAALRPALARR
jgi:creatinine amidohydrolase/Fe(II)-dependent formamide hydrolase-like protein